MPHATRTTRVDLLTWPVLGRFLKWRHARTALQIPLLLLAALMIFDGLFGPPLAPKNLATVGTWLHYRGLVVLALLLAGNLFCMACPFMLPRQFGKWLRARLGAGAGRPVPAALRNKWLAIALVLLFLYSYELFALWASPWLTAWVAVAYFAVAFAVDAVFRGAAFCKYVCPLGQFNFFGSLISPLEIKVRQGAVCTACRGKACITAQPTQTNGVRGCELWLFQERKAGNMDCTFCLDCVHACPYDNIGLLARTPTAELWADPFRSGIGRFSGRLDLAALVAVFAFAGLVNAFAMIRPVYALEAALAGLLGATARAPVLGIIFGGGLGVAALLVILAAAASRALAGQAGRSGRSLRGEITRNVYALAPMGFGIWLAHYSFHFLTGALTIVPVIQAFAADAGLYRGAIAWGLGPLVPGEWLFPIEAAMLYLGASGSLVAAFQIARRGQPAQDPAGRARVLGAALPWLLLIALMLAAGLWIMLQPMEMRGMLQAVGA